MTESLKLKGEYIIEKVNKDGSKEEIFRKENHLTPFAKAIMLGYFSSFFTLPCYNQGASNGANLIASGFCSMNNTEDETLKYIQNSLVLYGLNEVYSDVQNINKLPFTTGVQEMDESKVTFLSNESTIGEKYASVYQTDRLNLNVPNLISKSWKLTGPYGQGTIKTLCIGRNIMDLYKGSGKTTYIQNSTYPEVSKILCQYYKDMTDTEVDVTGFLPPIKDFDEDNFYFGYEASNNSAVDSKYCYKKYNITNDTFTDLVSTDKERNYPIPMIGTNAFVYNNKVYYTQGNSRNGSSSNMYCSYDITNDKKVKITNVPGMYYCNFFKKGDKTIVTSSHFGYETTNSNDGDTSIRVLNIEDGSNDTTLFGKYNPTLSSICNNVPSWFYLNGLGTRNDNENWLVYDSLRGIAIECTDLNDVLGTMVDWYYTASLVNTTINGKLYFLSPDVRSELKATRTENSNITFITTLPSEIPMIQDATLPTDMLSIVTDIKDKDGNDIIQTEDSEYIFTYNIRMV